MGEGREGEKDKLVLDTLDVLSDNNLRLVRAQSNNGTGEFRTGRG